MEYLVVIFLRPFVAIGLFTVAAALSMVLKPLFPAGSIRDHLYRPRSLIPDYSMNGSAVRTWSRSD